MQITTKSHKLIEIGQLIPGDLDALCEYLDGLSPITKSRFGPHLYTRQAIIDFYNNTGNATGFKAIEQGSRKIISYCIIYKGILPHERERLRNYGLELNNKTDATFAPSVADEWQGESIGYHMLQYILKQLREELYKRVLLWGGVQKENHQAVEFYLRNGFSIIGSFTYNGENYDMTNDLTRV
jgi:GNAT superfamily N-acetyltransferase